MGTEIKKEEQTRDCKKICVIWKGYEKIFLMIIKYYKKDFFFCSNIELKKNMLYNHKKSKEEK